MIEFLAAAFVVLVLPGLLFMGWLYYMVYHKR